MKKILLTLTAAFLLTASAALGQVTLIFNDNNGAGNAGTYTPGQTFSFDITLNVQTAIMGGISGYSLWFETDSANSGLFVIPVIPNYTGSPFDSETPFSSDFPQTLTSAGSQHTGFAENQVDLGAVAGVNQAAPGMYFLQNISFNISNATPNGTYTIANTSSLTGHPDGRHSVINSNGTTFDIESSAYTITIVPEPSTWAMLALGGIAAFGVNRFRARRRA